MQQIILRLGKQFNLAGIVALVLGLNLYWSGVLEVFGAYFQQTVGAPLLDLENVQAILPTGEAAALVATYDDTARELYWQFFMMDTVAPPLVFASYALLWVVLLKSVAHPWAARFLNSPLLFIPLGVGFFDWWENLAFVTAITGAGENVLLLLQIGQGFVWLKAICLFATFGLTLAVIAYRLGLTLHGRFSKQKPKQTELHTS